MTHDKFCQADMPLWCQCPTIAAIRADEREQAAQRVGALFHPNAVLSKEQCVAAARGEDDSHE